MPSKAQASKVKRQQVEDWKPEPDNVVTFEHVTSPKLRRMLESAIWRIGCRNDSVFQGRWRGWKTSQE